MAQWIICRNCGVEALNDGRGLCHACLQYQWRTGLPRPYVENVVLQRIRAVRDGARLTGVVGSA